MISRRSSSAAGSRGAARLLKLGAAIAMVSASVGVTGAAAANADTTAKAVDRQAATSRQDGDKWLDQADILGIPGFVGGVVFNVTANNGVPYIRDPRSTALWHNLRRVPGSQGGFVTNITISQDDPANYTLFGGTGPAATTALRVTARTSDSNIFFTVCRLSEEVGTDDTSVPFPPPPAPLPCTPWQQIST